MAIDINDLTGASKVRTASWEKEVRERWYKCESDESGTPQKIEHRVKQFLTYYGTDIEALLEGCEALEYILRLSGDEWLYYSADIGDSYYHYVERVIIDLNEAIEREAEGVSELIEPLALKRYRNKIEEQESYIYLIDKQIQSQQERITELEALTATTTASPEGQPTDEDTKGGTGRYGLLKLSCTQCIEAFALLLSEATGLELMEDGEIPSIRTPRGKAIVELYSVVSGKSVDTCKSYIRQRNTPEKDTLRGEKMKEVQGMITKLLRKLKRE